MVTTTNTTMPSNSSASRIGAWFIQFLLWFTWAWFLLCYFRFNLGPNTHQSCHRGGHRAGHHSGYQSAQQPGQNNCQDSLDSFWDDPWAYIPLLITYFAYLISSFGFSNTFSYLNHMNRGSTINLYVGKLFYTPLVCDFQIKCYHNERRTSTTTTNGKTKTSTNTVRVDTYNEIQSFKYMSWRDVSGPFNLNIQRVIENPNNTFVKLKINYEMELADDGSKEDYEAQKQNIIERNRNRDLLYDFSEITKIKGHNTFNLVCLGDNPNPYVCSSLYILSALFGIVELYKKYVDQYCILQEFTIKKLISTRSDLNDPNLLGQYSSRMPKIIICNTETSYDDPSRVGETTEIPDLPDINELNQNNSISDQNINYSNSNIINSNTFSYDHSKSNNFTYGYDKNKSD